MSLEREFLRCGRAHLRAGGVSEPDVKAALLGKTARYAPSRGFETIHIYLELDIDIARRSVAGLCRTTIKVFTAAAKTLCFDAVKLKVSSVSVDGKAARFVNKDGQLRVTPPRRLDPEKETEVAVRYRVDNPKAGLHFVYPDKRNPQNPIQVWSQSQPEDARHWYPCHDNPHEKCTSEIRASVPAGFRLVSNGTLIETVTSTRGTIWHWRMDRPHSIYLISIAAGRFSEIAERWQDVPVTFYCEKGREEDAKRGFGKTLKALDFFSKATGVPYPYDKYAQVAVAEYPGGMEHTTCTTQTDSCLIDKRAALDNDLDLLVAHELAHQWFGDLVTCRDWSHAWLNEGFATYFEILFQDHDKGRDEADYELSQNSRAYFEEDSRRYRRPLVCGTFKYPWTLFDRHTYEKGAWVVHMLRHKLGDGDFWRSIKGYLDKHRDGSVETPDLVASIAEATGRNLKPFFDQWVFRAGYPILRVHYSWDKKARKARLWVAQTQDINDENPPFALKLPVRFSGRGWAKDVAPELSRKEHRLSWRLPSEPLGVEIDPGLTTLKKVSLRKPHALWLHQLRHARRAHGRHEAAREAANWGDAATVAALEAAISRESFWGAACEMTRALGTIRSDESFRALARLLKTPHPKVRRVVIEALSSHRRPEAAALIAPFARRDASILVEAEAVRSLGALRAPKYFSLIQAALKKKSYRDLIGAAGVTALALTRDPKHSESLRRYSLPPHSFLRRAHAIRALADYAPISERAVAWICEMAADADERINLVAISSLGQLEDERALPTLEKARTHPNTRVRVYAEEALARIKQGLGSKPAKA